MKFEFLAMKWAITEKFRHYLIGAKFSGLTDNNPLTYFRIAKLGALEQRWAAQLAQFDLMHGTNSVPERVSVVYCFIMKVPART
nr:hypothetical protein BaRGS_017337 [Batillaria attramentaria]